MKTKINIIQAIPTEAQFKTSTHHLVVLDLALSTYPLADVLKNKLKRTGKKLGDLIKAPVTTELDNGAMISWVAYTPDLTAFKMHTLIRKAFHVIAAENPTELNITFLPNNISQTWVDAYVYVCLANSQSLPNLKKEAKNTTLKTLHLMGIKKCDLSKTIALVNGNTLTRQLTITPPNDLTPSIYRAKIKQLAKQHKWVYKDFSMAQLTKMGAGAFVAVGQGSEPQDAAIVHLRYTAKNAKKTIALVGKGICFDTGGHNLKPAKYMSGMHEDMNGSAVALGILQAATEAKLPVNIDCWLAIAQNHIGPKAYKQNDVVTALNGLTI